MRSNFFWGTLIVIVGGLFLLQNLGILNVNIWNLLWPFFLIALGAWIILGRFFPNRAAIDHGDSSVNLIEGDFGGGLEAVERMVGEIKEVTMKPRIEGLIFPWGPDQALHWDFSLAPNIPLELKLETGANDAYADLTSLLVERLSLKSGASSTHILLPANAGQTWVNIETGVTSVHLTIPPQVAGRIHYSGGLSSIQIDSGRFPKSGNSYQSPDFDTASNKVDIKIDTGIGSVIID
jgi:hypothetical protein